MSQKPYKTKWQKEHTIQVGVRLQRTTDGDLVRAIEESGEPASTFLKRVARKGLLLEMAEQSRIRQAEKERERERENGI